MDRFELYNNKVVTKLLSSKVVYKQQKELFNMERLIIAAFASNDSQQVAASVLASAFSRLPTFSKNRNFRTKAYSLNKIILTAHGKTILRDLNCITNTLLPAQIENELYKVKLSQNSELNWLMKTCRPPTQLDAFLFKYPISDDIFKVLINIKATNVSLFQFVYVLRLFQLPIDA